MKFAKLIELKNNNQVLLTIRYNDDEDLYYLDIRTDIDDLTVLVNYPYGSNQDALDVLEAYTEEDANNFLITSKLLLNNNNN